MSDCSEEQLALAVACVNSAIADIEKAIADLDYTECLYNCGNGGMEAAAPSPPQFAAARATCQKALKKAKAIPADNPFEGVKWAESILPPLLQMVDDCKLLLV